MALISVIIPTYNEEENLPVLCQRLQEVSETSIYDFEFIFVDDGSLDRSVSVLTDQAARDSRFKVVQFSRNFGSHAACLAGLVYARGDARCSIAADLQDPPEVILALIERWEKGYETVIGVREWEGRSLRIMPKVYWKLVKRFALSSMPESGTDVFLIDRRVSDAVVSMGAKNTSIFGLILWSGFSQTVVTYKKTQRYKGLSKWTLRKKIKLFIDTFVSFSYFPIRAISVSGMFFALAGFLYALFIIGNKLIFGAPIEGWSSLMVVLLVVSGVQLTMLGILGEYLWRNFDESRKRPPFIIKNTVGLTD